MLHHHDSRSYNEAASDAARRAKEKLEGMIGEGVRSAATIIEKVQTEVPNDRIVKAKALSFEVGTDRQLIVGMPGANHDVAVERIAGHALGQLAERAGIPMPFVRELQSKDAAEYGQKLLAHNLRTIYSHDSKKYLCRSYGDQLRGFLSDSYRRLDSRPLLEAFAGAAQEIGAVPIQGYGTDTKVMLKAMLPRVFEPVPNEVLAFGLAWENSDYGNGAHALRVFMLRLWCTNYAIADEALRQVHLGRRLSEDVAFSQKTYELDTQTVASAINDVVKGALSSDRVSLYCEAVKQADADKIDPKGVVQRLRSALTKGETEQVVEAFNSPDVENLPAGNTSWRLSNAISWIAGKTEDTERRIELEKFAAAVLPQKLLAA